MKFRVVGADMYTGEDVEIVVDAATRESANKKATRKSIVVLSIDPVDEYAVTQSATSIFGGLRSTDGSGGDGASPHDEHAARRAAATCQMGTGCRTGRKRGSRARSAFLATVLIAAIVALGAGVLAGRLGLEPHQWGDVVVGLARDAMAWLSGALRRVTGVTT